MIGLYLAWKVRNVLKVRVGVDAIMGCGNGIFLLVELIQYLQEIGRCTMHLIGYPNITNIWSQGCMYVIYLGLVGDQFTLGENTIQTKKSAYPTKG